MFVLVSKKERKEGRKLEKKGEGEMQGKEKGFHLVTQFSDQFWLCLCVLTWRLLQTRQTESQDKEQPWLLLIKKEEWPDKETLWAQLPSLTNWLWKEDTRNQASQKSLHLKTSSLFFAKLLRLILKIYYVCVYMCITYATKRKGTCTQSPGAGCELSDMGAGNKSWVLWKSKCS